MFEVDTSKVRSLMFEHEVNGVYDLAQKTKLNNTTAARVLKDGATATTKTIAALAKLFGLNGEELILKE